MKNLILLLTIVLSVMSCRSFQIGDYYKHDKVVQKLPMLEADFDKESFGPHFNPYDVARDVITGEPNLPEKYLNSADRQTKMANDVNLIFKRELLNNISERKGESAGYAYCTLLSRSSYIKNYWAPIVSVVTLGIANLAGLKFKRQVYETEISVEIFDKKDNHIATYFGIGKGEADVGLYTRYNVNDGHRSAFAVAFTNALAEIKTQIRNEHQELIVGLD